MNERQKRRRQRARLEAKAAGRQWQTGKDADQKKEIEHKREMLAQRMNEARRQRNETPIPTRMVRLPSESHESAERTERARWVAELEAYDATLARCERNVAHVARVGLRHAHQNVRTVDTPAPMIGAFRLKDI